MDAFGQIVNDDHHATDDGRQQERRSEKNRAELRSKRRGHGTGRTKSTLSPGAFFATRAGRYPRLLGRVDTSAAIAKSVILPTYTRWVEADRQLAVSALAYCEGKENLDTARADFLHAQKAWAELQPLLIGPLAEGTALGDSVAIDGC